MIRNWLNRGGKSSVLAKLAGSLGIGFGAALPARWKYSTKPTDARHWHNPADPVQAARIEAAAAKRERKARKLAANTGSATFHNHAHGIHCIAVGWKQSLNPTYIAK